MSVKNTPSGVLAPPACTINIRTPSTGGQSNGKSVWSRNAAFRYRKFGIARATVASVSCTPVNPQELPPGPLVRNGCESRVHR